MGVVVINSHVVTYMTTHGLLADSPIQQNKHFTASIHHVAAFAVPHFSDMLRISSNSERRGEELSSAAD